MKYPFIESTEEFAFCENVIRLWIAEKNVKDEYNNSKLIESIQKFLTSKHVTNEELAEFISKNHKNVTALQIKTRGEESSGVVIYFIDFNDNIHG